MVSSMMMRTFFGVRKTLPAGSASPPRTVKEKTRSDRPPRTIGVRSRWSTRTAFDSFSAICRKHTVFGKHTVQKNNLDKNLFLNTPSKICKVLNKGKPWSHQATLTSVGDRHRDDSDPELTFSFEAYPDPAPDSNPTPSFTHVGKSEKYFLLFKEVPVYIV
jgi:hypothetical protein